MSPMILHCAACSSQNFVSAERLAVAEIPPRCWKCGEPLPECETPHGAGESYVTDRKTGPAGETHNA
ncbi:MAG: hypothetical protein HY896_07555 [Deltaproteobacteria bacterium]|nr:hypothetical protein [Deltaproteobacteria bacterium]